MGASIACLMGYSGVQLGPDSNLCQAQAFMFELFMQSDPWWSFAMAINVYMVFFFSANPKRFLDYWWAYWIVCYGVPLIPAIWLLLLRDGENRRVYGNATIWCWIDGNWRSLRIFTYYLPIWVCIVLSLCIYVAVGCYVFKQRNQLRNLSLSNPAREPAAGQRDSGEKTLFSNAAVMGSINTEVVQTTTTNTSEATPATSMSSNINWFQGPPEDLVYLGDRDNTNGPATYHTVTRITAEPKPQPPSLVSRMYCGFILWRARFDKIDPVKLAYLRTSFVFAISVFVTWTPSSINRVYDMVHGARGPSFGLNLASAIVLPLQGVWNAVIFFTTSCVTVREEIRIRVDAMRGLPRGHLAASAARRERERALELERRNYGGGSSSQGQGGCVVGRKDSEGELSAFGTSSLGHTNTATGSTMRVMRGGSLTSL
ncbi:hypothetical protein DL766_003244 [Monosporascus sp. MC13-8B]|uniref:G-protein coupled receptors family 2 profile 2 domain-containing protein n=1 Tax=Monosporascus cannonballus TaxID=155416 RepID=A0ABY0HGQ4_9PEZI|nr:hypothetical protein DL762_001319 [Monosporascus cannonballus]RYP01646.1 hypothetical protein DL763_000035 [Monosporascus cannonballus]RYP33875.1 hypothetical protein DL766_003244 [Monosporascus sp. MC13-8B]